MPYLCQGKYQKLPDPRSGQTQEQERLGTPVAERGHGDAQRARLREGLSPTDSSWTQNQTDSWAVFLAETTFPAFDLTHDGAAAP